MNGLYYALIIEQVNYQGTISRKMSYFELRNHGMPTLYRIEIN